MSLGKIFSSRYFVDTNFQNDNFSIIIFDSETSISYKGIFTSQDINVPKVTIDRIYLMLTKALDSQPNFLIHFNLRDLNVCLSYHSEIIDLNQLINVQIVDESVGYGLNYQLANLKIENDKLKDEQEAIKKELGYIRQNYVSKEYLVPDGQQGFSINYFSQIKDEHEKLKKELEDIRQNKMSLEEKVSGLEKELEYIKRKHSNIGIPIPVIPSHIPFHLCTKKMPSFFFDEYAC